MPITIVRRTALTFAAAVAVALSGVASPAHAQTEALACVEEGNVWLHVEHGDVINGACATEFANVAEAMATTGLAPDQGSFYVTVDGVTAQDPQWWSLWTASVDNGELGEWAFAQVGAADLEPEAGQIVGWRLLEDYNKPQEAPQYDPLTDAPGAATPASSASSSPEASAPASADASPAASSEAASAAPTQSEASENETEADEPAGIPTGFIVGIAAVIALAGVGGVVWWRRRAQ